MILLIVNNSQAVEFEILFREVTVDLWFLVVLTFAVGVVGGSVANMWCRARPRKQLRRLRPSVVAPPAGFEPAHPAPEAGALSPELRGRAE